MVDPVRSSPNCCCARPSSSSVCDSSMSGGPSPGTGGGSAAMLSAEGNKDDDDVDQLCGAADSRADDIDELRPIVIDGSNIAMSHGCKDVFSCQGIKIVVDWFRQRGHKEITVFVPRWRLETPRSGWPIKDQEILFELERESVVVFTPSRTVAGKRITCYDDRYIVKLATENNGIIVSNDNYRDLTAENADFRKAIEERLLMYSFVNNRFMPPDDPLGRCGPSLDNFLKRSSGQTDPPAEPCPYGKRCTYKTKCRFFHPEYAHRKNPGSKQNVKHSASNPENSLHDQVTCNKQTLRQSFSDPQKKPSPGTKQPSLKRLPSYFDQRIDRTRVSESAEPLDFQRNIMSVAAPLSTSNKCPLQVDFKTAGQQVLCSASGHHDLRQVQSDPTTLKGRRQDCGHLVLAKKLSDEMKGPRNSLPSASGGLWKPGAHKPLSRQLTLQGDEDRRLRNLYGTAVEKQRSVECFDQFPSQPDRCCSRSQMTARETSDLDLIASRCAAELNVNDEKEVSSNKSEPLPCGDAVRQHGVPCPKSSSRFKSEDYLPFTLPLPPVTIDCWTAAQRAPAGYCSPPATHDCFPMQYGIVTNPDLTMPPPFGTPLFPKYPSGFNPGLISAPPTCIVDCGKPVSGDGDRDRWIVDQNSNWTHPAPLWNAFDRQRYDAYVRLCGVFPNDHVTRAMQLYPYETDPKNLCQLLMDFRLV